METWEHLFDKGMACLDTFTAAGLPVPRWTFGGGTALMLQIHHRESHDIDLFLDDPQWLSYLSPRLNDTVEDLCTDYDEGARFLKLSVERQGEIDFIAAPTLTQPGVVQRQIHGRDVLLETPAEIVAKKLRYRGAGLQARDVIDIAVAWQMDRLALLDTSPTWNRNAPDIARRISVHRAHIDEFNQNLAMLHLLPPAEAVRSSALSLVEELLDAAE